jgi:tetratricopeptide (TPR) repeat protein
MAYYWLVYHDLGTRPERERWIALAQQYADDLPRKERWYIEAQAAYMAGDLREEQLALERIVEEYPDEKLAHYALAFIYRDASQYPKAIASLQRVIEIDPNYKLAYNFMAYVYNDMGDLERSITAINQYVALAPEEANPLDTRGDLYAYNGKLNEAASSYRAALAKKATFHPSLIKLGLVSILLSEYERADSCFSTLAAVDNPKFRSAGRVLLALPQAYQGHFADAIRVVDDGLAADRMEQSRYIETAYKYALKAELLTCRGAYAEAMDAALRCDSLARAISPDYAGEVRFFVAEIEELRGNGGAADSVLEAMKADIVDVHSRPMHEYSLAKAHIENMRGNHRAALADLKSTSSQVRDFRVYRERALVHLGLGEPADAITQLEKIVGRLNEDTMGDVVLMVGAEYYLGVAYEDSGWSKRAIEQYEKFLARWGNGDPGLPYVDDARGRLARLQSQS